MKPSAFFFKELARCVGDEIAGAVRDGVSSVSVTREQTASLVKNDRVFHAYPNGMDEPAVLYLWATLTPIEVLP